MTVIGENVRLLRERRGLSQMALAEAVGVRQGSISELEKGRIERPRFIVDLARELDVTPEDLNTPGFAAGGGGAEESTYLVRLSETEWDMINHFRRLDPAAQEVQRKAIRRASARAAAGGRGPSS